MSRLSEKLGWLCEDLQLINQPINYLSEKGFDCEDTVNLLDFLETEYYLKYSYKGMLEEIKEYVDFDNYYIRIKDVLFSNTEKIVNDIISSENIEYLKNVLEYDYLSIKEFEKEIIIAIKEAITLLSDLLKEVEKEIKEFKEDI